MSNLTVFLYYLPFLIIASVCAVLRVIIKHQQSWRWSDERKLLNERLRRQAKAGKPESERLRLAGKPAKD